ncbi:cathepsin O-like [Amphibalanus amphitrite]|uniref:cathepsin O-like n=1 Tax=Amphibalanus amphitrite TaxID=1232801 RepID=UPI001C922806|nr:cathepsin O-like [Amphibalanus amphitrite]
MDNRYIDYFLILVSCFLLFFYIPMEFGSKNHEGKFLSYIEKYNKSYEKGSDLYTKKLAVFKESLDRAERLNAAGAADAEYGVSPFSDLTPEEFRRKHLSGRFLGGSRAGRRPLLAAAARPRRPGPLRLPAGLPARVDWRERGVVTSVRNQADCGACWAFSTVEVLESMNALRTGNLTRLSVQQLIDCSTNNLGCTGGDVCWALEWMAENGVVPDKQYPLKLKDQACVLRSTAGGVRLKSYRCAAMVGDEEGILRLLATQGPVAVGADATSWQDYVGGIIRFNCERELNHAVQIVGYDMTGAVPYYIVRNSWGTEFGLDGYLHVAVGSDLCGLSEEVGSILV